MYIIYKCAIIKHIYTLIIKISPVFCILHNLCTFTLCFTLSLKGSPTRQSYTAAAPFYVQFSRYFQQSQYSFISQGLGVSNAIIFLTNISSQDYNA